MSFRGTLILLFLHLLCWISLPFLFWFQATPWHFEQFCPLSFLLSPGRKVFQEPRLSVYYDALTNFLPVVNGLSVVVLVWEGLWVAFLLFQFFGGHFLVKLLFTN